MRVLHAALLLLFVPVAALAQTDYGDAPDSLAPCSGLAYPDIAVYGHFPTVRAEPEGVCRGERVSYTPGAFLGTEADGDAAPVGPLFPPYDVDECFLDGDAGLLSPAAWTIATGGGLECGLRYVACFGTANSIGEPCGTADWRFLITNESSSFAAFLCVLVDWNRDGDWCDEVLCGERTVRERVIWNFPIITSSNAEWTLPDVPIGATSGHVWTRVTVERQMRPVDWDGSGAGVEGEAEDYLLLVGNPSAVRPSTWGSIKARYAD